MSLLIFSKTGIKSEGVKKRSVRGLGLRYAKSRREDDAQVAQDWAQGAAWECALGGMVCVSGSSQARQGFRIRQTCYKCRQGRALVRQRIGCSVWRDWVLQADGLVGLKAETRSESLIPTRRGGVRAGSPLLHVISF